MAQPVKPVDRSKTLDAIRGFALLGILGPNLLTFAWPFASATDPSVMGGGTANEVGQIINILFFQGKMMFLFAMLFGAGVLMFARKFRRDDATERPGGTSLWYTRCSWLLLIGLFHGVLFWYGDILVWYAIAGLGLVWWARNWSPAKLIAIAIPLFAAGVILLAGFTALGIWAVESGNAPPDALVGDPEAEIVAYTGTYLQAFQARIITLLFMWLVMGPLFVPAITGIMLFGMAMLKTGFLNGRWSLRSYSIMAALGLPLGLGSTAGVMALFTQTMPDYAGTLMMTFAQTLGIGTSLAYASLIAICVAKAWLEPITNALAAVGRFALSNYLLQTIICTFVFYGWGLGQFARVEYPWLFIFMAGVWAINISFSLLWKRWFRFGPAEWVWRSLTYLKPQPMLRQPPEPTPTAPA